MEHMARELQLMVPCGIEECDALVAFGEIEAHRSTCKCSKFACPLQADCGSFLDADLAEHVRLHRKSILTFDANANVLLFCFTPVNDTMLCRVVLVGNLVVLVHILCLGSEIRVFQLHMGILGLQSPTDVFVSAKNRNTANSDYESLYQKLRRVKNVQDMPLVGRFSVFPQMSMRGTDQILSISPEECTEFTPHLCRRLGVENSGVDHDDVMTHAVLSQQEGVEPDNAVVLQISFKICNESGAQSGCTGSRGQDPDCVLAKACQTAASS